MKKYSLISVLAAGIVALALQAAAPDLTTKQIVEAYQRQINETKDAIFAAGKSTEITPEAQAAAQKRLVAIAALNYRIRTTPNSQKNKTKSTSHDSPDSSPRDRKNPSGSLTKEELEALLANLETRVAQQAAEVYSHLGVIETNPPQIDINPRCPQWEKGLDELATLFMVYCAHVAELCRYRQDDANITTKNFTRLLDRIDEATQKQDGKKFGPEGLARTNQRRAELARDSDLFHHIGNRIYTVFGGIQACDNQGQDPHVSPSIRSGAWDTFKDIIMTTLFIPKNLVRIPLIEPFIALQ